MGCGGDDTCDPVANSGCDDNQACERVQDKPTCVAAVVVVGRVFDLETDAAVEGVRIVARRNDRLRVRQAARR